jgi:hypothetical protein
VFMTWWHDGGAWFSGVLSGMATPAVIALVLALTTLLLEDLAIAAGVALATQGAISWGLSLLAVGGGIALGDLGLYGVGLLATRVPWLQKRYVGAKSLWAREKISRRLGSAVLLARVIPGLRLATYTTSGFVRAVGGELVDRRFVCLECRHWPSAGTHAGAAGARGRGPAYRCAGFGGAFVATLAWAQ